MTTPPLDAFLASSTWTRQLTDAQLDRIRFDMAVRPFAAGTIVCARATPSAHWLGVMDGMLKLENITEAGKSSTFASVPAGAWFGEGAVLKGEPRPYEVVALRDSEVAFLPRSSFMWLLENSHPFALWMVGHLNARLGHFVAMVQNQRLGDITAQVAYGLAGLFHSDLYPSTDRRITLSQEEIGRLCGLSRQVVNRTLQELQDRGAIRLSYGSVEVTDLDVLKAIARGE